MIGLVRKNIACSIAKHSSFVHKSHISLSFPLQFFERQFVTSNSVYDVLVHKHQFSPQVASVVASDSAWFRSPEKVNLILSFLEEIGFSTAQLEKIVKYNPRILKASVEDDVKFKIKIFQDLGLSSEDITKIISSNLYSYPRCLLIKPDLTRKSVDKAKEMAFCPSSKMFIYAVRVIASMSKDTWELKLQAFRDLGFSDSDMLAMFRKAPLVFNLSMENIRKVKELLLATGKFNISSIVMHPASLCCSI